MKPKEPSFAAIVCRRVADAELPLVCLIAPTLLFPRGPLPLAGLTTILGLWIARLIAHRRVTVPTPLDLPMLLLLVMAIQALYPSTDLTLSMPKLYGVVLGVTAYYAVVNGVRTARGWWWTVGTLLLAGVGVAAVGLVSTAWISKLPGSAALYSRLPRLITSVESSFGTIAGIHPNEVGGTLAFLLPVAVGVLLWGVGRGGGDGATGRRAERSPQPSALSTQDPAPMSQHSALSTQHSAPGGRDARAPGSAQHSEPRTQNSEPLSPWLPVVAAVSMLTAGPALLLTMSRSALAGMAVAVALLLGLRWRRVGYLLAVATLVGVVALAVIGPQLVYEWAVQLDQANRTGGSTLVGREEVWNRALYMIQDFPFTGIGLNTFPKVLDALYPSFLAGPDARIPHAHDIYLQTAVDLGLAGLMAFVGIWMIVGWQAVLAYRRSEGLMRGAIAGLGAGCAAYLIYGLTDAITLGAKPLPLLWMMVGLIVVANRIVGAERRGDAETRRRRDLQPNPLPLGEGQNRALGTQHSALSTPGQAGGTSALPAALSTRARWVALEAGRMVWMLYWAVAILFAGMAYLVVGISISGWVP